MLNIPTWRQQAVKGSEGLTLQQAGTKSSNQAILHEEAPVRKRLSKKNLQQGDASAKRHSFQTEDTSAWRSFSKKTPQQQDTSARQYSFQKQKTPSGRRFSTTTLVPATRYAHRNTRDDINPDHTELPNPWFGLNQISPVWLYFSPTVQEQVRVI